MKSNLFDKKLLLIFFVTLISLCLISVLFNNIYIKNIIAPLQDSIVSNENDFEKKRTKDGLYDYYVFQKEDHKEVYITKYNGNETDIVIPSKIENIEVTKIGDSTFTLVKKAVNISIPKTVKIIGHCAFAGCSNLESITISESVIEMGQNIFVDTPKVIIYTYENSVAHKYAIDNNIAYELLSD